MNYGVIVAAGKSDRMGPTVDKVFLSLGTRPVLAYSLMAYERCAAIDGVVLVVRRDHVEAARAMAALYGCHKVRRVIAGGARRQLSVMAGLEVLEREEVEVVSVHDGARPCVTAELIAETVASARRHGSGVAARPITDTVKQVDRGQVVTRTVDRSKLWAVQTPQSFRLDVLLRAMESVARRRVTVTDEASAVESIHEPVRLVRSEWSNIKITEPADLELAATLLKL